MREKSIYTKKLGKTVAALAKPGEVVKLHVISGDSNWRVVSGGSVKALKAFSTVEQAVDYAKEIALKKSGEVVVHGEGGETINRITYNIAM